MAQTILRIKQGDADTLTETISGLASLSGYSAKLYIYTLAGVLYGTITGSISDLDITYQLVNETTKAYVVGTYSFETKIFDSSDHVYTPSWGKFIVEPVNVKDPA